MEMHHHQHPGHHPQQHVVAEPANAPMDYGTIKHLLSEAELQAQQSRHHLMTAESQLLAAQSTHTAAKLAYDESIQKVERLKSQFREQIMDEGLRQTCRWNDMYFNLVKWKEEHDGDTTVPCDAKSSEEVKKLNRWVVNQRTAYKYFCNGDKKHIKDHRIDALNKIGFVWSVTDHLWDNNFELLRRHHAESGTFDVTHKQNRKLAAFVSRLRTAMSHKNKGLVQQELTDERIKRLNSINFSWEIRRKQRKAAGHDTVKFDTMYGHLVSFKQQYGHLKVNKLEKEWKKGIGAPEKKVYRRLPLFMAFVRKEQLAFAEGLPCSLDEEKVRLLTELGVEWRKPVSEPRKSTGGEASRKKRKRVDLHEMPQPENHMEGYYQQQHLQQQQQVAPEDEMQYHGDLSLIPPPEGTVGDAIKPEHLTI